MIGAKTDKDIYDWAKKSRVNGGLVKQRLITLNHDDGARQKLSTQSAELEIFLQRQGKFHRVRETSL